MKNWIFILLVALALIISGCSDDSDGYGNGGNIIDPIADVDVRINEISYTGAEDIIELKNYGSEAVDVSNFFMCSLFSYTRVGELQIMSGAFTIPAGGILLVCGFELNDFVADLGLYSSNAFEDPEAMLDFLHTAPSVTGERVLLSRKASGLPMILSSRSEQDTQLNMMAVVMQVQTGSNRQYRLSERKMI